MSFSPGYGAAYVTVWVNLRNEFFLSLPKDQFQVAILRLAHVDGLRTGKYKICVIFDYH